MNKTIKIKSPDGHWREIPNPAIWKDTQPTGHQKREARRIHEEREAAVYNNGGTIDDMIRESVKRTSKPVSERI